MKRRGFLASLLALVATPAVSALPGPGPAPAVVGFDLARPGGDRNALFRGEVGRIDGVEIYEGLQWSPEDYDALRAQGPRPLVVNKIDPELQEFYRGYIRNMEQQVRSRALWRA